MQALINAASEAVSTRRADIEKLADALVERMSLNSDEARQLVGY
jgi:polyhydroxyalkanoate synthesis regulator phasin